MTRNDKKLYFPKAPNPLVNVGGGVANRAVIEQSEGKKERKCCNNSRLKSKSNNNYD
jgi:hypothetical protein